MENLAPRLEEIYGGRRWILASQAAVATVNLVETFNGWGSECIVVAASPGTGDMPEVTVVYTDSAGATIVEAIRAFFESVESPTADVQAAVDQFDPESSARVIAEPYATAASMLSRQTYGVRRPEWYAWEDKMRVDRLWEELDIPHAPYRIVPLERAGDAAAEMTTQHGTVWVADNSSGWHGGAEMVHWVQGSGATASTIAELAGRAMQVRVMPFLDGLPCSIHGWVTTSGVAVFLPVEITVLRHADSSGFLYAGVSTNWRPADGIVEEMRGVARKVGQALSSRVGYLGPFGVDGVLTAEGFLPTELNPRMSAGAGVQLSGVEAPLGLVMRAEIEGDLEVDPDWLESSAIEGRKRHIHMGITVTDVVRDAFHLTRDESGDLVETVDADGALAEVKAGPASTGSYVTASFDMDQVEEAAPTGSLIADVTNLAAERWSLAIPKVAAAQVQLS